MPRNQELERLVQVYDAYRQDPTKQAQWDQGNPGNAAMRHERNHGIWRLLHLHGFFSAENRRVLDIGCGTGDMLAIFLKWGLRAENLIGVDLLPDRIEQARRQFPTVDFVCANAEHLDVPDGTIDLVLFLTVFSSILDRDMRKQLAEEAERSLRKGGCVLWYDFRYNNPANPHVSGLRKEDVQRLFPNATISLETITLLPPVARKLGRLTPFLYPLLSNVAFLRTHYLGLFQVRGA